MVCLRISRSAALLLFDVCCAAAQQSIQYGSISGGVKDASGAVIQDAKVTCSHKETNIGSTLFSDKEGRFRFRYLSVGEYELVVRRPGFSEIRRSVNVGLGSAFDLSIVLPVAQSQNEVTVSAQADVLEAARTQIAGTVTQAEVNSLPLNGRNFLDLALLVPGVSPANTAANQLFAETSAVPGQGVSVGSQRNFSNNFVVDGLSNNDDAAGLTGVFYGLDVVNEFQVVTSGAQAEFGRALGGYVNMVSRSGANQLHGDLYFFFKNQRFNAANSLAHLALPITQSQYGVSIGGPVIRNRTFYFVNFEQRELNQSGLTAISPANVSIINTKLASIGYAGSQIVTGLYPNPVHNANVFSKLDHHFGDRDQASIRYSVYHVTSVNSRGAGGLSAPSASANLNDTDQTFAATNVATLSPRLVNETRAQFTASDLKAPPSDPIGPAVSISGVASFGTLSGSPTARANKLAEGVDNLSYQTGAHAIRVGADFLYNDDVITFPRSYRGSYSFASLAAFLSGTYNSSGYTQTFANSVVAQTNPNVGFYAQDEWKVAPRFTLNLGLRYDLEFLRTIATNAGNLSPRGGFAWTPFASRKTVIRGGYGLFYDRIPLRPLANALLSANNTTNPAELSQISVSLSPGQAGAPAFPDILSSLTLPAGVLSNFSTMDRRMRNAYSEQGSFEIEHQFGAHSALSVGYQRLRGLHLIISVNQNAPACAAVGSDNGCRPNPNYGNDSQYSPRADSNYNGLHVSYVERPSSWTSLRISYAYSKALDDVSEFFFSAPINNSDIWQDYGRSDDDQRHRLVVEGAAHSSMAAARSAAQRLSHGFQLSAFLQSYSPLPFNITTGANTIQGTSARPAINGAFISRNAGTGFDFFSLGARVSRSFRIAERLRLEALAEAFNLANHVNGVTLNGVFGTATYPTNPLPTYRQMTAVNDPRTMQFALRLSF